MRLFWTHPERSHPFGSASCEVRSSPCQSWLNRPCGTSTRYVPKNAATLVKSIEWSEPPLWDYAGICPASPTWNTTANRRAVRAGKRQNASPCFLKQDNGFSPSPPFTGNARSKGTKKHHWIERGDCSFIDELALIKQRPLLPRASIEHGQAPLDASGSTGTAPSLMRARLVSSETLSLVWRRATPGELLPHPQRQSRVYASGSSMFRFLI
jgi:hypothetical protein